MERIFGLTILLESAVEATFQSPVEATAFQYHSGAFQSVVEATFQSPDSCTTAVLFSLLLMQHLVNGTATD